MERDAIVRGLRDALARRPAVRFALLFGSAARGAADERSDVDVAILAPGLDVLALGAELSGELGREVDAIDLRGDLGVPLLDELLRDGVLVWEAAIGSAADWRARVLVALETDRPWYERMRDAFLRRLAREPRHHGQPEPPGRQAR